MLRPKLPGENGMRREDEGTALKAGVREQGTRNMGTAAGKPSTTSHAARKRNKGQPDDVSQIH